MDRYHHVRGIGGSTLHFTGESHRLHPAAMKMKTRFGVAADWPLDYAALEPYYVEAEQLIGVAGPPSQGARWRSREFPLPPHPLSYASQTLGKGARSLGLNWQANSRAALSLPFKGRAPCNYCGGCNQGCPRGDKGSADVTLIPAALATGRCTVRPESPVIRLEAGRDDRVAAVLVGRPDGSIERLAGRDVVLACGAVETPRLLLASDGLGNESGEVGQNFMDTLFVVVGALHPEPQHGRRGLPSDAIAWDFNAPDAIASVVGGCRFHNGSGELGRLAAFALRAVPGWGQAHAIGAKAMGPPLACWRDRRAAAQSRQPRRSRSASARPLRHAAGAAGSPARMPVTTGNGARWSSASRPTCRQLISAVRCPADCPTILRLFRRRRAILPGPWR
jgi:choline dehydrogenase-like flavoprotein